MRTILVIEDDTDAVDMLSIFLEKFDYKVAGTGNGIDGLTMIKFLKPDVIIVDLKIPGMDGKNLIKQIRENVYMKGRMVVVISGRFKEDHNGETIPELDAQAVFSKPLTLKKMQKLYETIESFYAAPAAR
jgi:DNA-binding response OmpR family regulator